MIRGMTVSTTTPKGERTVHLDADQAQEFLEQDPENLARQWVDRESGEILDQSEDPISDLTRQLNLGPDQLFPAPAETQFGGKSFKPADDDLEPIASALIDTFPELHHLMRYRIGYLWRKKGGASKGRLNYGKIQLNSGLLTHFTDDEALLWLAADNLKATRFTNQQVMALLYSLLLQLDENEETGKLQVIAPEVSVFSQEIRRFGIWWPDPERFSSAVMQLDLFGGDAR